MGFLQRWKKLKSVKDHDSEKNQPAVQVTRVVTSFNNKALSAEITRSTHPDTRKGDPEPVDALLSHAS